MPASLPAWSNVCLAEHTSDRNMAMHALKNSLHACMCSMNLQKEQNLQPLVSSTSWSPSYEMVNKEKNALQESFTGGMSSSTRRTGSRTRTRMLSKVSTLAVSCCIVDTLADPRSAGHCTCAWWPIRSVSMSPDNRLWQHCNLANKLCKADKTFKAEPHGILICYAQVTSASCPADAAQTVRLFRTNYRLLITGTPLAEQPARAVGAAQLPVHAGGESSLTWLAINPYP